MLSLPTVAPTLPILVRSLKLDPQTFSDLEVFHSADEGPSLFDVLDHTRTSGGRNELRHRFKHPFSRPQEIREVQDAVRFLIDHPDAFTALRDEQLLATAEQYLRSNYATVSARGPLSRFFKGTWTAVQDRPFLDRAVAGVSLTRELVQIAMDRSAWSSRSPLPPLLRGILSNLRPPEPVLHALVSQGAPGHASPGRALSLDHQLRTEWCDAIQQIVQSCYQLDALSSMAEATARQRFSFPDVLDSAHPPTLTIRELYHPFLANPVRNDLRVSERPLLLLTGPNMAGKTTYLRATALAVYLAQIGMGVPAASMRLSPFEEIFTGISTSDSIRQGYSYFLSEVRRVKQAVSKLASGERVLVIFDEMFRGTNVKDAFDASLAVVRGFARCQGSAILVSSHLAELAPAMEGTESVQSWHFEAEIRSGVPEYSYKVRPGSSTQRLGLLLLEREGVFALLSRLGAGEDGPSIPRA